MKSNHIACGAWLVGSVLLLITMMSPTFERFTNATRGDYLVERVCLDRHGYYFPSRWSCRSTLHGHIMPIILSCAFNLDRRDKGGDICRAMHRMIQADGRSFDD
jgi:hypothetical protein